MNAAQPGNKKNNGSNRVSPSSSSGYGQAGQGLIADRGKEQNFPPGNAPPGAMEILVNRGGELVKIDVEARLALDSPPNSNGAFRRVSGTVPKPVEWVFMVFMVVLVWLDSLRSRLGRILARKGR